MSHTQARTEQTDIEHIQITTDQFGKLLMELQEALQTAVSAEAKVALIALIEIAESGLTTANRCLEQIERSRASSSAIH